MLLGCAAKVLGRAGLKSNDSRCWRSKPLLHLDIDVLDASVAPGVNFPTQGGLFLTQLEEILGLVAQRIPVIAASLTALDPTKDREDETLRIAMPFAEVIAASIARERGHAQEAPAASGSE